MFDASFNCAESAAGRPFEREQTPWSRNESHTGPQHVVSVFFEHIDDPSSRRRTEKELGNYRPESRHVRLQKACSAISERCANHLMRRRREQGKKVAWSRKQPSFELL